MRANGAYSLSAYPLNARDSFREPVTRPCVFGSLDRFGTIRGDFECERDLSAPIAVFRKGPVQIFAHRQLPLCKHPSC